MEPIYDLTTERMYSRLPETYRMADRVNNYTLKKYVSGVCRVQSDLDRLSARIDLLDIIEKRAKEDSPYSNYKRQKWVLDRINFADNTMMKGLTGATTTVRTNTCTNDSLTNDLAGWSQSAEAVGTTTLTRITTGGPNVSGRVLNFARMQWTAVTTGLGTKGTISVNDGGTTSYITVTAGKLTQFSWLARCIVINRVVRTRIKFWNVSNVQVGATIDGTTDINIGGSGWTPIATSATVPAGATKATVTMFSNGGNVWNVDDTMDMTAVLTEAAPRLLPFFNGSTPDGDGLDYVWVGTIGSSASQAVGKKVNHWDFNGATLSTYQVVLKDGTFVTRFYAQSTIVNGTLMGTVIYDGGWLLSTHLSGLLKMRSASGEDIALRAVLSSPTSDLTTTVDFTLPANGAWAEINLLSNKETDGGDTDVRIKITSRGITGGAMFDVATNFIEPVVSLADPVGIPFSGDSVLDYDSQYEWQGDENDSNSFEYKIMDIDRAEEISNGWADIDLTSDLADPETADDAWLNWLAQLVGVDSSTLYTEQERRDAIATASTGFKAGSHQALEDAARSELTGTRYVKVFTHSTDDTNGIGAGTQWDVLIVTRSSETPSGAAVVDAVTRKGAKPAGVRLFHKSYESPFSFSDSLTWDQREELTWSELEESGVDG